MELTKQEAKENLQKLIEKFNQELAAGHIDEYNEEATKTSFIQPFLKDVLGWDMENRNEVSPEERITKGRVDYGLKIDGRIKVFGIMYLAKQNSIPVFIRSIPIIYPLTLSQHFQGLLA